MFAISIHRKCFTTVEGVYHSVVSWMRVILLVVPVLSKVEPLNMDSQHLLLFRTLCSVPNHPWIQNFYQVTFCVQKCLHLLPLAVESHTAIFQGIWGEIMGSDFSQTSRYLKEFRVEQCKAFLQHKCNQHRPFTCFHWHFMNQRRRRPVKRRDGTFNYSPDVYCSVYDETTGICPNGDKWVGSLRFDCGHKARLQSTPLKIWTPETWPPLVWTPETWPPLIDCCN